MNEVRLVLSSEEYVELYAELAQSKDGGLYTGRILTRR